MNRQHGRKVVMAGNQMRLRNQVPSPFLNDIPLEATMKKTLLIAGALLALTASMATAGGVNLSWTDCGAFGQASRTNACTNNGLKGTLYGSAIAPQPMPLLNGQTGVVDLQTTAAVLSPWWLMMPGGCVGRTTAASASMDFTADTGNCVDIWAGQASPGFNYNANYGGPNRVRMKATGAVASAVAADDVSEMYIFKISIGGARTVGAGVCAGCLDGACFVLNDQLLTQPIGVGDYHISNPILRQHVSWQASGASIPNGCPGGTPSKNATWGSVKALYR